MIVDDLINIDIYKNLSVDIYSGLMFLKNALPDIEIGEYNITAMAKAIVSKYETKEISEQYYEAHWHTIDIQYPVIGKERIKWSPVQNMKLYFDYDPLKDRVFYINPSQSTYIDIGSGIFAIMFPDDAHSPKHCISIPQLIKKITIKVKI